MRLLTSYLWKMTKILRLIHTVPAQTSHVEMMMIWCMSAITPLLRVIRHSAFLKLIPMLFNFIRLTTVDLALVVTVLLRSNTRLEVGSYYLDLAKVYRSAIPIACDFKRTQEKLMIFVEFNVSLV